jgi:hypothetical protein
MSACARILWQATMPRLIVNTGHYGAVCHFCKNNSYILVVFKAQESWGNQRTPEAHTLTSPWNRPCAQHRSASLKINLPHLAKKNKSATPLDTSAHQA